MHGMSNADITMPFFEVFLLYILKALPPPRHFNHETELIPNSKTCSRSTFRLSSSREVVLGAFAIELIVLEDLKDLVQLLPVF
jgi:hypothetical protein